MNAKILIVDDATNLLRLIGFTLHKEGYETIVACNGEEALQKVKSEQPDLVILDVMLPDISGIEVCRQVRQNPNTANLPIIMLSALGQVPNKVQGLEAGADEYLTKPIETEEMAARVAALLERTERLSQSGPLKRGKVLCFMGAKGGVGTTTVALNTAAILASQEKDVVAVELRTFGGSFPLQLGQVPSETLADLLALEPQKTHRREVNAHLVNHPCGLQMLFGSDKPEQYREIDPEKIETIIEELRRMADYIIVDLPSPPTPAGRTVLQACDFFTLIVEREPACVQSGKIMLELLKSWGVHMGLVGTAVVNRVPLSVSITLEEISAELDCKLVGVVPQAAEACLLAQKRGVPLVVNQPNGAAALNLAELAKRVAADKITAMSL